MKPSDYCDTHGQHRHACRCPKPMTRAADSATYLSGLLQNLELLAERLDQESWSPDYDNIETGRLDRAHDALTKAIAAIRVQAADCTEAP